MKEQIELVKVDTKYCDYLRNFDDKIIYNKGRKELRPFVGVLFTIDSMMYFAPLSSPKTKHLKIKTKLDFLKIDNGKLGAINFNNMIPVMKNNISYIDLNKKTLVKSEQQYIKLLKSQLFWLNRHKDKIYGRSKKLYDKYINNQLNINIKNRCCNFPLLEEKSMEYNKILINN